MLIADFVALARPHADFEWLAAAAAHVADFMDFDGAHDAGHLLRVLRNAATICSAEPAADREVVAAAALMHDLVNLPKDHPDRAQASTLSAEHAVGFFAEQPAFTRERLTVLSDAIRTHSFSANLAPRFLESRILRDADRLEALGAFGLARCFQVSGALGRAIIDMADPWADGRELDDVEFAVDHFFTKLLDLHETFSTTPGRRMARARTDYLRGFLDQLARELDPSCVGLDGAD